MMDAGQQSAPHCTNDDKELSLVDLLWILIKRKKILIRSLIIVPLLTTAAYVLSPYKTEFANTVAIQVGRAPQVDQLEGTELLIKRLELQYPFIDSIEAGKEGATSILSITVRDSQKSEAVRELKEVVEQLLKEHNAKYLSAMANQQQKKEIIQQQIDSIRTQLAEITSSLHVARKKDPSLAVLLVLEKGQIMEALPALEEAAINLKISMNEPLSRQTRVIAGPTISNSSAKPKVGKILLFGVLLGLMLGVVGVFLTEFIVRTKAQTVREK